MEQQAKEDDLVLEKEPENKENDSAKEIEELKEQLKIKEKEALEARAEAKKAEEERQKASATAEDAMLKTADAQEAKVVSEIDKENAIYQDLRRQYREAYTNGDADALDDLNDKMLSSKIKLTRLSDGKAGIERWKQDYKTKQQEPKGDITTQLSPAAQKWLNANPEIKKKYIESESFRNKVVAAHYMAVSDGIAVDSDKYYDFVGNHVTPKPEEDGDPTSEAGETEEAQIDETTKPIHKLRVSAPVSTASRTTAKANKKTRTLSALEVEAAEMCGMTPEEYIASQDALRSEGKLK